MWGGAAVVFFFVVYTISSEGDGFLFEMRQAKGPNDLFTACLFAEVLISRKDLHMYNG